jgi:hypothetical protein
MLENFPATHASQMRFEVLEGLVKTCEPALHVACSMQNVLPSSPWNSAAPHTVQLGVLLSVEYCPAGQSWQRSGVLLLLFELNRPGVHWIFTSQNGWPVSSWYLPLGHTVQIKLAFENSSTKQPTHVASVVASPAFATCWPAEHCVCATQNVCASAGWN